MEFENAIKSCTIIGDSAEHSFIEAMTSKGCECIEATSSQNKLEHWDYMITHPKHGNIKVDIKAEKKQNRYDDDSDNDIIWIEFKNIFGYDGWIYGKSDYIVFLDNEKFMLVLREDLEKLCVKLTGYKKNGKNYIYREKGLYKLYQRFGRQDIITMIKKEDLKQIKIWNIYKL